MKFSLRIQLKRDDEPTPEALLATAFIRWGRTITISNLSDDESTAIAQGIGPQGYGIWRLEYKATAPN